VTISEIATLLSRVLQSSKTCFDQVAALPLGKASRIVAAAIIFRTPLLNERVQPKMPQYNVNRSLIFRWTATLRLCLP
jgi:hypothetical protein